MTVRAKLEGGEDTSFQFKPDGPKPDAFAPEEWRIVKDGKDRVAAEHIKLGVVRKIPKAWLEA